MDVQNVALKPLHCEATTVVRPSLVCRLHCPFCCCTPTQVANEQPPTAVRLMLVRPKQSAPRRMRTANAHSFEAG